ncbi:MAG: VCBS repeat-containing protein [Polyangiaceae bacterium]|nr:VCBS repeat-containing protein [Polyangiaceae bacterium]
MRTFRPSHAFLLSTLGLMAIACPASAQEYFTLKSNAISPQGCNGNGCWTNYMQLADFDNDGDLDAIFPNSTGFFQVGNTAQPLLLYTNDGNANFGNASMNVGSYTGWVRQVAIADVTGDGFLDMYVPSAAAQQDQFLINDGTGKFTDQSATRLPGVKSKAGATRFGDVDNDGDLDLLVGDNWTSLNGGTVAHLYLNDGGGNYSEAPWDLPTTVSGDEPDDFDLFDMDGDFDLDLFVNMHSGTKGSLWQNDGTGKFTDLSGNIPVQQANPYYRYGPVACDVDGDGDLDIWQDNAKNPGGMEQLLINDGTGKFTDETTARVTGNPGADDNGVACIDVDGDGDLDAAIMSLSNVERVLKNDGAGNFTLSDGAFTNVGDPTLWFDFGDLNGDGKLDCVTAQGEGSPATEQVYTGSAAAPVDTVQPKIRAVESIAAPGPNLTAAIRFAVSDNATTDEGPRLQKAFIKISAPAAQDVTAMFMGGDLFRATLPGQPMGTKVDYQACAIDRQGNQGCSAVFSYTVSDMGGTGGAGTGGGSTGTSGTGASGTGGNGTGASGTGGNGTGAGGPGSGGSGGTGGNNLNLDDGGCGCSVPGGKDESGLLGLGLAGVLVALGRRRRNRAAR